MKLKSWLFSLVVLTIAEPMASAAVFERDWKAPGDGLLTYDDVNQREWLDVPYTIEQFPVALRDPEPRFQAVQQATMLGGSLESFRIATPEDVVVLAESAGIDVTSTSLEVNGTSTQRLIELLGPTRGFTSGNTGFTSGIVDGFLNDEENSPQRHVGHFSTSPRGAGLTFFSVWQLGDIPSRFAGVMLYRQIPEPSTMVVVIVCSLFCCYFRRACRRNQRFQEPLYRSTQLRNGGRDLPAES